LLNTESRLLDTVYRTLIDDDQAFIVAFKTAVPKVKTSSTLPAVLVASGIMLSRLVGLVRQRVFAHYLGSLPAADAFQAALRIPNFLQNLLGEGVLSASFIPVYARLLAGDDEKEADRVASVIGSLLAVVTLVLVLLGILVTPLLIDLIAPGFTGETRQLTITLVQILFPGVGTLVLSAWCLGILNSHGRFFLSYAAPVLWSLFIIAGLIIFGNTTAPSNLVIYVAWSSVAGSLAQLLVQVPTIVRVTHHLRFSLNLASGHVKNVLTSFVPVFISRGVVQLSAYIDNLLASLLPSGSVALLGYAQTIGLLPISLFGMSISAAELPAMSRTLAGNEETIRSELTQRLATALKRLSFFIVPAAVSFFAFGDTIAALFFQSGRFNREDALYIWALLGGSGVGLLASTSGRVCSSAFYALRDTRTPLRYAIIRVILTLVLGYLFAFPVPHWLGLNPKWGLAGLPASAGLAGWVEYLLLQRALRRKTDRFAPPAPLLFRLWSSALFAALLVFPLKFTWLDAHPVAGGIFLLSEYGLLYFALTFLMKVEQARLLIKRFKD
jgi:putative peptidoglycan lipid II flippase